MSKSKRPKPKLPKTIYCLIWSEGTYQLGCVYSTPQSMKKVAQHWKDDMMGEYVLKKAMKK